ncbi:MAG: chromophore lyase CpcT/CpeT [Trichodesmium sp. MAG_R01]|nr:chromophore lyase CpcT/CpeT [Trichodesmium sp. MAG_R01]
MITSNIKTQENLSQAITLSHWLAGEYSSIKYTLEDPRTNPHIRIFFRPLPYDFFGGIGFYSEEIYDHDPWHPHYQFVKRVIPQGDSVRVENYALKDPDLHTGAGQDLEILATLTPDNIELRKGCAMIFKRQGDTFVGGVEPGHKCLIPRGDGSMTYLVSEVKVTQKTWTSRDTGYDVNTHEKIWGSNSGPFKFDKVQDFSGEIPDIAIL